MGLCGSVGAYLCLAVFVFVVSLCGCVGVICTLCLALVWPLCGCVGASTNLYECHDQESLAAELSGFLAGVEVA